MNCPVCPDTQLQMTERQGVEIDYCPKCRGVWLDRGELDKIIDRGAAEQPSAAQPPPPPAQQQAAPAPPPPQQQQQYQAQPQQPNYGPPPAYGNPGYRGHDDSDYKFRYPQQGGHYKKRKGFLGDIFDF